MKKPKERVTQDKDNDGRVTYTCTITGKFGAMLGWAIADNESDAIKAAREMAAARKGER